jgi:hypothetical protein
MILREAVEFTSAKFFGHPPRWASLLRLALTFAMLVAAPIVGILAAKLDPVLIFALIGLLALPLGLQSVFQRPSLAPVIILIAAAFVPISLPTGTGSRLVDSLLLTILFVGMWVLRMLIADKRLHLVPSPVNRPLLSFILVVPLSLIWGIVFRDPLVTVWNSFPIVQLASAIVMIMLPGAFLLVTNHVNELRLLKIMIALILIAGVIGLVKRFAVSSIPINTEGLFTMWIIAISAGLGLLNRKMTWPQRGLLLALTGAFVFYGFVLNITWLAGWLPGLVVLGVLVLMRSKKLLAVFLVFMVIFISLNSRYYLGTVIQNEETESGGTRLAAWAVNWQVTGQHLLLGTGPAGYTAYYMSYFPSRAMATHSNYIDIISQTGIIGLGIWIWFFFTLTRLGYKLCLRLKGRGDFVEGLANAALAGTVGCIVIMAFGDWLIPFAYTQTIAGFDYAVYNWLFMGTIPALDRLTRTEERAAANA